MAFVWDNAPPQVFYLLERKTCSFNKMTKTKIPFTEALDFIVELLHRYDHGTLGDKTRKALDSWHPDTKSLELYPINEDKASKARAKVRRYVSSHIRREQESRYKHAMWIKTFRQYAVVAVLIFFIAGGVWMVSRNADGFGIFKAEAHKSWVTDPFHKLSVTLPDGTEVKVNAGSRLEIAKASFGQNKREVWLTGEAFFDVTKDPEKPFIIHTGSMQTIVRGTSFNVKAYEGLGEKVVTVRNGRVEVIEKSIRLAVLTANRQLTLNTFNHKVEITSVSWQDAAGWINGRLVLNGAGVEELRLRLKQQYGVEVHIQGNVLEGQRLSGSFDPGSQLSEVMNTIAAIYAIRYTIENNQVTLYND
jgi:transmembrane sensor